MPALSDYGFMLKRGDQVPHFEARTASGDLFRSSSIWQHKNLVLVALPEDAPVVVRDALAQAARSPAFDQGHSVYVITRDLSPAGRLPQHLSPTAGVRSST